MFKRAAPYLGLLAVFGFLFAPQLRVEAGGNSPGVIPFGTITPNHCAYWVTPNSAGDAGFACGGTGTAPNINNLQVMANISGTTTAAAGTDLTTYLDSALGSTASTFACRTSAWLDCTLGSALGFTVNALNVKTNGITAAMLAANAVDLSTSTVTGNLGVSHLNGGAGAGATTFWRGDGTWAVPAGGGGSTNGTVATGTLGQIGGYAALGTTIQGVTVVGDITLNGATGTSTIQAGAVTAPDLASGAAASNVGTLGGDLNASTLPNPVIKNAAVSYAKMQNVAANSLVGNPTGLSATAVDVGLGSGLVMCGTSVCPTVPDRTSAISATVLSTDMGGQINMNGSSLTLTIPAISSTVFANGMSNLFGNYNASALTISSSITLNGLPSATSMHDFGWANCTSNGTSLDCYGFPGFGTITNNALGKFLDATGAETASSIIDDGTTVKTNENIDVESSAFVKEIANDTVTGTAANKLAQLTGVGKAVIAATSTTQGIQGIVVGGNGTSGSAMVAFNGIASCVFDGATTANDFVTNSTTTTGDCHDAGATAPTGNQTIGQVLSTNGGGGTYLISMQMNLLGSGGGGGTNGTVNPASDANQIAYYPNATSTVSGNTNMHVNAGQIQLGTPGSAAGSVRLAGATSGTGTLSGPASITAATAWNLPDVGGTLAVLGLAQTWTAPQRGQVTVISASSTATPNFDTAQNFEIDLGACPCTLANPSTTPVPGQSGFFKIIGSNTGTGTITTWGTDYLYVGGTASIVLAAASATGTLDYIPYSVASSTAIVLGTVVKGPTH